MVVFLGTEAKIDLANIREIEGLIGFELPTEYAAHLLRYNGGQCTPNMFIFQENGRETKSSVDWFLAIYDGEYDNLKNYIQIYKLEDKRLPDHILPIAHDPGGNLICISCNGDDKGYIYFWNHEEEIDYSMSDNSDYSNLYLISNSFESFINGLL